MNGKMIEVGDFQVYHTGGSKKSGGAAVLWIHEYWGLTDLVKKQSDALTEQGYDVVAIDLYDGKTATDAKAAAQLMNQDDPPTSLRRLEAAVRWMQNPAGPVRAAKVATIGFCFGGGYSFKCALHFGELLKGSVIYYGQVPTIAATVKNIKVRILGIFAKQDDWINPAMVAGFKSACEQAHVPAEIYSYDAVHAFANPTNARFEPKAAADAWAKVTQFFERTLGEKGE